MSQSNYVAFLVIGIILVAVDGQLIYRSASTLLQRTRGDTAEAASSARLVSVLFHLIVLGVLALISTVHVPIDDPMEQVVTKLGIVLIILAIAHGITMVIVGRMRDRQHEELVADEIAEARANHPRVETTQSPEQPVHRAANEPVQPSPSIAPGLHGDYPR